LPSCGQRFGEVSGKEWLANVNYRRALPFYFRLQETVLDKSAFEFDLERHAARADFEEEK